MQITSTRPVVVEPGGEQVAAHVGLHSLGRFADAMALGDALSQAIPTNGRLLLHDRGKVVLHTMLMLAGGGEACTDIEHLRAQPELFGAVPSDSTVYRTFTEDLTPEVVEEMSAGMAAIRASVSQGRPHPWVGPGGAGHRCHPGGDPLREQGTDRPSLQGRLRLSSHVVLR
ncbi:MAG TPA: hypothetical protein VNG12_00955, partial [Acidimicrobiales bacterium]|nr:hypothetical protein [Acidimicrobiales bacterium]